MTEPAGKILPFLSFKGNSRSSFIFCKPPVANHVILGFSKEHNIAVFSDSTIE